MNMRIVTLIALLLSVCSSMLAQDLSLQRGENQDLGVLLGEKLDHNGLVINPTPQA